MQVIEGYYLSFRSSTTVIGRGYGPTTSPNKTPHTASYHHRNPPQIKKIEAAKALLAFMPPAVLSILSTGWPFLLCHGGVVQSPTCELQSLTGTEKPVS